MMANEEGIFCSTAGHVFKDKSAFTEHYKSDFHLYNLKRKVAGLPPVSREWFDKRKAQLITSASKRPKQQIWTEPLTKKKFQSEATYNVFIQSKKYQSLLKEAQLTDPPVPLITEKSSKQKSVAEKSKVSVEPQEWDVKLSLFDHHVSDSLEANLEYMFKKFGFYFPNTEFLLHPESLLKYLGAKLSEGHIPLYVSGLSSEAKQFGSLQAVRNHMIDVQKCTMLFEGNEEEYEDFYNLKAMFDAESSLELALGGDFGDMAGFELAVEDTEGRSKILGSREFAYLYRQRHRPFDARESVLTGQLVAKYRALGIATRNVVPNDIKRARKEQAERRGWTRLKTELRTNVNSNLPRNVPY